MEHIQPIHRPFSWRGAALAVTLLAVVAVAALGGVALVNGLFGTRPGPGPGHGVKGQSVVLRPRAAMSVLVLNGNGRAGAAGRVASRLLRDGYRSVPAANAQVTTYAISMVLYRPGWEAAADRLAKDARIHDVEPLDGSLPAAYRRYPLVAIVGR